MLTNVGNIISSEFNLEKISIIDLSSHEPRSVSFGEINKLSDAVARGLLSNGIGVGDKIAILSNNSIELIAAFFGSMRLGAIPVLINTKLPDFQIQDILTESKSKLLFTDQDCNFDLLSINFKKNFENFLNFGNFNSYCPVQDDVAFILYTSGSSGDPKGTLITHRGHLWAINRIINYDREKSSTRTSLISAPLYHANGLTTLVGSIAGQSTIVLLPKFTPFKCLKAIETYCVDTIYCVPTMLTMMIQEDYFKKANLSSLRQIRSASSHLSQKIFESVSQYLPNVTILNSYGITEVGPALFGPHPLKIPRPVNSVGYPAQGIEYRIIDGILQIKSPSMMKSYDKMSENTFTKDGFFVTNDLFQIDSNGFYYFLGRSDDMFKCGGNRIYPKKIEEILESHPAVMSAVVLGVEDSVKEYKPYAFVIVKKDCVTNEKELKQYALENLPVYCHPRKIWIVDQFPLLTEIKINQQKLKQLITDYYA
jgi:long-chain acyl-CoA synthetase